MARSSQTGMSEGLVSRPISSLPTGDGHQVPTCLPVFVLNSVSVMGSTTVPFSPNLANVVGWPVGGILFDSAKRPPFGSQTIAISCPYLNPEFMVPGFASAASIQETQTFLRRRNQETAEPSTAVSEGGKLARGRPQSQPQCRGSRPELSHSFCASTSVLGQVALGGSICGQATHLSGTTTLTPDVFIMGAARRVAGAIGITWRPLAIRPAETVKSESIRLEIVWI